MFRPPYLARVAAGAAVYALEETRRLPSTAIHLPITAISQLLQTSMHLQQFVTSLALKGDEVFDRLANRPVEQPEWATFDEDLDDNQPFDSADFSARLSRFDLFRDAEAVTDGPTGEDGPASVSTITSATANGYAPSQGTESDPVDSGAPEVPAPTDAPAPEPAAQPDQRGAIEPEVATRYDYANMTLAQLRARLRMLSVADLSALLEYEKQTFDRAPFVTMLTNRIATVQAK
ncbi:lipid droplet-associated protein [Nocardia sp. NPDC052254]|uniref:lipid droplet-associated protein n=1 Tax=Nocardia sp. NPDC052254 TaxID=3155681 RepID=UPI00343D5BF6